MIALLLRARDAKHVAVFTIHEPPNPPADRVDRAEAMVFVEDGFSWGVALFAPLWLAIQQLGLALGAYLLVACAIIAGFYVTGINEAWTGSALVALNVWIGFEASEIKRQTLAAGGWADAGTVSGRNLAECERRFFDNWLAGQPLIARSNGDRELPAGVFATASAHNAGSASGKKRARSTFFRRLFAARA